MFGWARQRRQLVDEIEEHIALETQENIDAGMSPDEARRAAQRKFGNVPLALERSGEIWGWYWLERIVQDVQYALRGLGNARGYTVTLILTLALGMGAVATILAIVDSVLLRPVSLPESKQLMLLYAEGRREGTGVSSYALSYKQIDALRRYVSSFAGVGAYNTLVRPVDTKSGTKMSVVTEVSTDLFATLGVKTRLGRLFVAGDAKEQVALVSDEFWRDELQGDSKTIGLAIRVSGKMVTVVGVLPANMRFPQGTAEPTVYVPISLNAQGADDYMMDSGSTIVRIRQGVSKETALENTQQIFAHSDEKNAAMHNQLRMVSYREYLTGDVQKPLWALLGAVAVLLLIACANAANLQIGRAASRMPEMEVRMALGASYRRLLQQLITENILVSLVSAALGSLAAWIAVLLTRRAYGGQFARFDELSVHPPLLCAVALLAIVVGTAAACGPLLSIRRQRVARGAAKNVTRRSKLPAILVALQVGLTCVLLMVSGLFLRTFRSLENVKPGFDPHDVTTLVLMPKDQHQDAQISRETETRLLHRFESLAGVESVTMQTALPFSSYNFVLDGTTEVVGRPFHDGETAHYSMVSTDFVRTSGIHLLQGRSFTQSDESGGTLVVLVNEAFVHKYLAGRDAVGATIHFHRNPGETDADIPFAQMMTVVGVVENELEGGDLGAPYQPMVYIDYLHLPKESLLSMVFSMMAQYAVRSKLPESTIAAELRSAVKQEAPEMAEMTLRPMEQGIADSLKQRRLALRLVGGFGAVALLLSAVGMYGVLAYSVTLRRREIGIRMALGSSRTRVTGLVMRQAGAMVLFGLIPGIAGAWAAGYAVRSFLFGVKTLDPVTLAGVALVLVAVATAAAFMPALHAAMVDPMETLRAE
ncbi:ADOP family duplicated permease [Acidicapsa dinghuensis]|uniref:ADOP family duplicated permease n=1 Tax=Acidicapsa dinghuensis TaxID=2218256 RepID=A0ABW1EKP5_9BACT|nr:ADOP family duplicated permease [Acidicapsa dinghuensis]